MSEAQEKLLEPFAEFIAELIAAEIIKGITEKEKREHEKSSQGYIPD